MVADFDDPTGFATVTDFGPADCDPSGNHPNPGGSNSDPLARMVIRVLAA